MIHNSPRVVAYVEKDAEEACQDGLDILEEERRSLSNDPPSISKIYVAIKAVECGIDLFDKATQCFGLYNAGSRPYPPMGRTFRYQERTEKWVILSPRLKGFKERF